MLGLGIPVLIGRGKALGLPGTFVGAFNLLGTAESLATTGTGTLKKYNTQVKRFPNLLACKQNQYTSLLNYYLFITCSTFNSFRSF